MLGVVLCSLKQSLRGFLFLCIVGVGLCGAARGTTPSSADTASRTQNAGDAAQLTGKVNSTSGKLIAGAAISLENLGTHWKKTALSSSEGSFLFAGLLPGEYKLEVAASGSTVHSART
jgi:hypothetical protein